MIEDMPGSIEFFPVPEVKTPIEPPPNKQLDFKRPVIDMPWREVPIDDPPPDPGSIQGAVAPRNEPVTPPPLPPRAITRIMGGPGKGFPNTDDYYPSAARRMSEQGVTAVRVCVDEKGSLMEQPAIAQTSGSARLDEGALKLARAGSGRYRASTEDGRPVSSCYAFRIKFELTD
jgi:TonB family protein